MSDDDHNHSGFGPGKGQGASQPEFRGPVAEPGETYGDWCNRQGLSQHTSEVGWFDYAIAHGRRRRNW